MIWAYTLVCVIYGTTFLAIRVGDDAGMPPFFFAAARFAAAGFVTLLFVLLRDRSTLPRTAKVYGYLLSIGVFNTTIVFAIVYHVEQFVPSGYAALMAATMPFMVMLLGSITNKQTITLVQVFGLVLGFVGVMAIAWPGIEAGVPHWWSSTVWLLLAQIAAAIGTVQSRKLLDEGTSPFVVNGFQVLFGSIGLFVLAGLTGGMSFAHVHALWSGIAALLYLTLFGSIVAATLYFWLVRRTNALIASSWTYVSPVIAVLVGFVWLHERIYVLTVVGTAVILVGVFLLNQHAFREALRTQVTTRRQVRVLQK
jgi:drug/metabolite transporter (DMT)-like permease